MSLADRLEAAGVVLTCAIVVALPMGALFGIYDDSGFFLSWWLSLLALAPGTVLGGLVVHLEDPRLTHTHVWRFGVAHWLTAVGLWQGLGVETPGDTSLALACWAGAFVVGLLVAAGPAILQLRR